MSAPFDFRPGGDAGFVAAPPRAGRLIHLAGLAWAAVLITLAILGVLAFLRLDRPHETPARPELRPTLGRYVPPAGPGERELVITATREVGP